MAPGWSVRIAIAAALVAGGCAAIAGLQEPSELGGEALDGGANEGSPTGDVVTVDAGDDAASAEIGNGSGRDGPIVITDRRPINDYAPLATAAAAADTTLTLGKRDSMVTTQATKPGDVLLVVQSAMPGAVSAVDLSPIETDAGKWALVRVVAVDGDLVRLAQPIGRAFVAPGAQVVRVPQATTVEVADNAAITAPRWDGITGGVVAFLATDAVILNGNVEVNATGFRGARAVQTATTYNCQAAEGLVTAGFAPRGEGIGTTDAGPAPFGGPKGGRGNVANGGGGGDCHNSGGAGGGNGGRGGAGGLSYLGDGSRAVGGLGGAALARPMGAARLRFGGGGGAGEGNDGNGGNGGTGGGVAFVRAPKLSGNGEIQARGSGGGGATGDGAGGGGAGGTIYLDVPTIASCGKLAANGGGGGNSSGDDGPGGGGGGGVVFMRGGASATCAADVQAGVAGKDGTNVRGAAPAQEDRGAPPYAGVVSGDVAP